MCIVCFAKNCAVLVFSKFDSDFTILFIKTWNSWSVKKNVTGRKKEFCARYYSEIIKKLKKPYSEINILEYYKELFSLKNEQFKIDADLKVFDFSDFELKEV